MKIFNIQVYGLEEAIIRSGYPMRDNVITDRYREITQGEAPSKDIERAKKLGSASLGEGHDNFLQGIIVQCDIEAPNYWWPQFQRYHFADIISSQSKVHRITRMDITKMCTDLVDKRIIDIVQEKVQKYNTGEIEFEELMSNVPEGLQLTAGITTNYRQIKTMYRQRKDHMYYMWNTVFREFAKGLPMAKELGILGGN